MMKRYSWLLFDADGTILDYEAAEAHSLKASAAAFGFDVTPGVLSLYQEINSALWADLEKARISSLELRVRRFKRLASRMDWDVSPAEFSRIYLEELGNSGFLIAGVREMLDELPGNMHRAIITNGITDTQYGRLKKAELMNDFYEIIISEEAGAAKPAAAFFDFVLDRIGFRQLGEMLIIGDSLSSDIAGGVGYGIDTCWYNPERRVNETGIEPTYEISGWDGLFEIIT